MKMKFHIPDFCTHWELNLNLIDMINDHPEYFNEEIEISSCFGSFAPALWNGGRALGGYISREQITNTIKAFNERNVPLRFTFTNPTITEKDLKDPFCNRICKQAENGFNEIICNTPVLEEYIRKTYPKYPLISSTCKQLEEHDALMAEFEKDYKLIVLDYNWNNDFERLAQIPEEYRSRCEILINPYCVPHCKRRGEHYRALGECQRKCASIVNGPSDMTYYEAMAEATDFKCENTFYNFYQITKYSTFVPRENLDKYMEMGFNNFKIEGRVLSKYNVLESYVYYMVKPEYKDMVRLEILNAKPRTPMVSPMPGLLGKTPATPRMR